MAGPNIDRHIHQQQLRMEGYLLKQNPRTIGIFSRDFKKRWFTLGGPSLYYFEDQDSSVSLGNIDVARDVIAIRDNSDSSNKYLVNIELQHAWFELVTVKRTWVMVAQNEQEKKKWLAALAAIRQRMERKAVTPEVRNTN